MIKIFEHASFPSSDVVDRNRFKIAQRLNPKKFLILGIKGKESYNLPENIKTIKSRSKYESMLKLLLFNPNIIHSREQPRCLTVVKMLRLCRPMCKHVLTLHGIPETKFVWVKKLIKDADVVTTVSYHTAKLAKRIYDIKSSPILHEGITVIPMGRNTTVFVPQNHYNERLRILFVGRYAQSKHPELVIEMARHFPECDFVLYGDGPLKSALVQEAYSLKNVQINPHTKYENLPQIYANSDIFLFPSVREGLANAIIEAMACGLPIICFNTSSMPELVDDKQNGFLITNKTDMKNSIKYLVQNEDVRKEMGLKARKKALQFDWSLIVPKWAKLFEQVAG